MDFGRRELARSREAVNHVMKRLLEEMRKEAKKYEGLRIDSYIRQGSSRDGLKVISPDEYDSVLEFHIEGLNWTPCPVMRLGHVVPGFCFFKISQTQEQLQKKFPRLHKEMVFQNDGSTIYLCSKSLHERVLTSLVDTAARVVERSLPGENVDFTITRKKNPPAINITIRLNDEAHEQLMKQGKLKNRMMGEIDLDIVPAICLRKDGRTTYQGITLDCPVHAVCKWVEGDTVKMLEFVNQKDLIWHVNSAGYEKHTLDVARTIPKQQYILTALRITKTFFVKAKKKAKDEKRSPPQFVSVLKSYHLKQLALYLIMYTCHLHSSIRIDGANTALTYFLCLLEAALEVKHLPHFYYSNSKIQQMYPGFETQGLKYDHFRKAASDALLQALKSLQTFRMSELLIDTTAVDSDMKRVVDEFKKEISSGEYF